jgi:lipopolysaccharide export system permease protein
MQFLWKYIDDLVGKGLPTLVIIKLFAYTSTTLVPMAMPIAVLLSAIMTFGNLGENYELTAMKAAGISLIKIMFPLIVFNSRHRVTLFGKCNVMSGIPVTHP